MNKLYITILAGGMGKRMQSDLPKVLHKVKGEAMIVRLLKQIIQLNPTKIIIVVGKAHELIRKEIASCIANNRIIYVIQPEPLGTGDAIKCMLGELDDNVDNIILNGDSPMLKYETVNDVYQYYHKKSSSFVISCINIDNPTGNGRIILENDEIKEIVEEKDCSPDQKNITLVNCGIYICNAAILSKYIPTISNNNAQSEYYLTDLVKNCIDADQKINVYILPSDKQKEIYNINTKAQLEYIEQL